jgi:hypothetical protein
MGCHRRWWILFSTVLRDSVSRPIPPRYQFPTATRARVRRALQGGAFFAQGSNCQVPVGYPLGQKSGPMQPVFGTLVVASAGLTGRWPDFWLWFAQLISVRSEVQLLPGPLYAPQALSRLWRFSLFRSDGYQNPTDSQQAVVTQFFRSRGALAGDR